MGKLLHNSYDQENKIFGVFILNKHEHVEKFSNLHYLLEIKNKRIRKKKKTECCLSSSSGKKEGYIRINEQLSKTNDKLPQQTFSPFSMNVAGEVLGIVTFFNVFKQQNVPMGELIIREKALESAKKLNILELRTSKGWLNHRGKGTLLLSGLVKRGSTQSI